MINKKTLQKSGEKLLIQLRDERDLAMATPDVGEGRPHSHGETDNARGLRIRALSISITKIEEALMWMNRSFYTDKGEYTPVSKE